MGVGFGFIEIKIETCRSLSLSLYMPPGCTKSGKLRKMVAVEVHRGDQRVTVNINTKRPLKHALCAISDQLEVPLYSFRLEHNKQLLDVERTPAELGLSKSNVLRLVSIESLSTRMEADQQALRELQEAVKQLRSFSGPIWDSLFCTVLPQQVTSDNNEVFQQLLTTSPLSPNQVNVFMAEILANDEL